MASTTTTTVTTQMHPLSVSQSSDTPFGNHPHQSSFNTTTPLKLRPGPKIIHLLTSTLLLLLGIFALIGTIILFTQSQPTTAIATLIESFLLILTGVLGFKILRQYQNKWWKRVWIVAIALTAGLLVVFLVFGIRNRNESEGYNKVGLGVDGLALALVGLDVAFVVLAMLLPENSPLSQFVTQDTTM